MDIIESYDLNADASVSDHDMMCIQQAGKLQKIGYLEYEAAAYGCAVYADDIYYFVSESEESAERFVLECLLKGLYPTSINYFFSRFDVLHETEDEIRQKFKLDVARKLKQKYPRVYLENIKELTTSPSLNAGFPILTAMMHQLENLFDIDQLSLFKDFAEYLLKGRHINLEGYRIAVNWFENELVKFSDESQETSAYKRVYTGFAYIDLAGNEKFFCDAVSYNARKKRDELVGEGCITSPILEKAFYAERFQGLLAAREQYMTLLKSLHLENYFKIMDMAKKLPTSVNEEKYKSFREMYIAHVNNEIKKEYLALGQLWNVISQEN